MGRDFWFSNDLFGGIIEEVKFFLVEDIRKVVFWLWVFCNFGFFDLFFGWDKWGKG